MKKIFTVFIILVAFLCAGCVNNNQAAVEFDENRPWVAYLRTFESETSVYKISKYFMVDENTKILVTDDASSMTYKITRSTDEQNTVLYTLTVDFKIVYTDSEYLTEQYKGKTDTITSETVFRHDNLTAVSTAKTVVLGSAPDNSYSYSVDYVAATAKCNLFGEERTIDFEKGSYYDNDYLYYLVRAMKNAQLNESFEVINWYECFINNKFEPSPMVARTYGTESVAVPESVLGGISGEGKDSEGKTVNCNTVQIMLNRTKAGSPLYAWYTAFPYQTTEDGITMTSNKLLAKIATYEYTNKGIITYRTEYNLSDFIREFK